MTAPAFLTALWTVASPRHILDVINAWGDDAFDFLRHQAPRILAVLLVAFVLSRLLKVVSRRVSLLSNRQDLPSSVRAQQIRTLSSVTYSVGIFVIVFIAAMQILALLGVNMGPLLASAGVAGLAIGFGAQTLVKDFINGFFILAENQYDIGDTIRIAGVQGVVENMTLRRTVLRDADGTVHTVPSSEIKIVSNLSRDWIVVNVAVSVAYTVDSDRVMEILKQASHDLAQDPAFTTMLVAAPEVLGIDRVSGGAVDYLITVRVSPGSQFAVKRELRRRTKAALEANNIEPGDPNRVVMTSSGPAK